MGEVTSKVRNYSDATPFDSQEDAALAIMQYRGEVEPLEASQFSVRQSVAGEYFVAIIVDPFGWLYRGKA